ncbi:MAG: hypothetical protein K0Q94_3338 [Paenibacillus sp.]|nr:hypothetical protein [Paenibacillus sp.]
MTIRLSTRPVSGVHSSKETMNGSLCLTVESASRLYALNSSIWGGGFQHVRRIVNRQVSKSYMCDDPEAEMEQFIRGSGYDPGDTAAMLTAAFIEDAGECHVGASEGLHVSAWVTAGLGNAARAGTSEGTDRLYPGTINSIVIVDGRMTDAAMVNAVITATEAKAAALQELGITARNSTQLATGTTTDAVLIAVTGRGELYRYAGTATRVGHLIGRAVYEAALQAMRIYLERARRKQI